ncbi:helix-turn-helix transcriptional regulator [Ruminococcus sp.]|uniref:helix-turn-helix transcriptional regulator n=1 Tax=Ruminococcus sp. TaxID=41978 RepID=UPI00388EE498
MTLGQKIRCFRVDQKMTTKDLADAIGYSATAVAHWEKEERMPSLLTAKDLCDYMGITVDELLKGVDK